MAGVYKRASDRARGKAGKWTMWWSGPDGKKVTRTGTTDKSKSLELARHLEAEAAREREGLVTPAEKARRKGASKPLAEHIEDYREALIARGGTAKHAKHIAGVLARLLEASRISSVAEFAPDRIQVELGRIKSDRSARTANHALGAIKAFAAWLEATERIDRAPRGLALLERYNEEADRRVVRRALSGDELDRLLAATERGKPMHLYGRTKSKLHRIAVTGPERAMLYRLAMGTGFRADELRSLTPESFELEGDSPTVTVKAAYSKNGKEATQPITRELADRLKPFLEGKAPGKPVVAVPEKTADMLRRDLLAAGIVAPQARKGKASAGVVDFHALRASYITNLIRSGANPRAVQLLARHSNVNLTLERYTHLGRDELRKVISGGQTGVDTAALRAAKAAGLETGGWMPKGFKTEIGDRPVMGEVYGMREHPSAEYPPRTEMNVGDATATLWISGESSLDSRGFGCTRNAALKFDRPFLCVSLAEERGHTLRRVVVWLQEHKVAILNVAGNRESKSPGIGEAAELFLCQLFVKLKREAT